MVPGIEKSKLQDPQAWPINETVKSSFRVMATRKSKYTWLVRFEGIIVGFADIQRISILISCRKFKISLKVL